jgi:membrane-bound lytic murein transglycosylase B
MGAVLAIGLALGAALPRADLLGDRIPRVALDAYLSAAARSPQIAAGCDVKWEILAAIGRVETNHGRIAGPRRLTADGDVSPPIRGRALDGTFGTQAIPDTDGGELDDDAVWDRAVGPLQFIPTTWAELGRDGNDDGVADPDNVFDAALTAAAHLCLREPGDYADRSDLRRALIAYNRSAAYADDVLGWVDRYESRSPQDLLVPSG